ncbi:mannose-6-phosphate isomerase, class I [Planotetraspora kaengkrachanensis]|uniref:mannose-6-phosphate isomerase n=1 Tax=Planotetraspora kaengkrachanensis TaxID=575193 RepID=A0A8J3V7W1_9ACTN|nr:mannose-6-phosphate isomerase, class I [Planotetraspora kaengkrachanensis]GIG81224.1 mannose-6-phosphate isomerase, class I [Planotetraspora kaengkrachanensis]
MDPLSNPIKDYAWGSRTAIAGLTGRAATGPEAEMWLGAHPSGPSRLVRDGAETTLDQVIAADPEGSLGEPSIERFGRRLPYLMKLIAVDQPLSLQVHPTSEQAAEAFARGDSNYSDPWHKPEMICALTPFSGLAGFRPSAQSAMLVERLQVEALQPVVSRLAADDVLGALRLLLEWPGSKRELVDAIVWAAASVHQADYELVCRLARQYPEDPAVLAPLLMHRHELAPGEALYLGAGVLHCYLDGFGVEIMAGSDNVLRAGLTGKRIDVEELLRITEAGAQPLAVVQEGDAYVPPAAEFLLRRITPGDGHVLERAVPRIVVCTEGTVGLSAPDGTQVKLHPGESVFVPASDGPVELSGEGTAFSAEPQV